MSPSRLLLLVVAGGCFLLPAFLHADEPASPWSANKQFSADMVITNDKGQTFKQKIYNDDGKVRTEITSQGMQVVSILRPDQQKMYSVMVTQKMVMEMPFDPEKSKSQAAAVSGPQGKFEEVGPDTQQGVACIKYKVTSAKENKGYFFWVDAATKAPVMMMADDNSVTIQWKNYKAGPQDAALFEPPADYQKVTVPGAGAAPSGGQ